jgi:hypothetical protein
MQKTTMPERKSPLLLEISNKKVLQDEQIIIALNEYEKLLYYVSGGNEKPKTEPQDTVRPEDADLRGWFTQAYGKEYLALLTSDLENAKDQGPRVNQIVAAFAENDYGYGLRVAAVNAYHLGRIIAHATNVYEARTEASAYSKEIATLCIRLLLSGNPPDKDLYPSMHTSISSWYNLKGRTMSHNLDTSLGTERYYAYTGKIILSLFDMHKGDSTRENWHEYIVPGFTQTSLDDILSAIDGVSSAQLGTSQTKARMLMNNSMRIEELLGPMVNEGWNQTPKIDTALKTKMDNAVFTVNYHGYGKGDQTTAHHRIWKPVADNLSEYENATVGAELPRNLVFPYMSSGYGPPSWTASNSNSYWINYDTWAAKNTEYAQMRELLATSQTELTAQTEADVPASYYYDINAFDIYNSLMKLDSKTHAATWMNYCYARVKKAYGMTFSWSSITLPDTLTAPYPALLLPPMSNETVGDNSFVDIGKIIYFYAKAYQGISPVAYWSACLGKRLVAFEKEGFTEIYMYHANMVTGGIKPDTGTKIASVTGSKENAVVIVATYLPEVPIYTPGKNEPLQKDIKSAFTTELAADPSLSKWIIGTQKSLYSYAYVINSSWLADPDDYPLAVSQSPEFPNEFPNLIFYQAAGNEVDSNYRGVKTFKPHKEYLKVQPKNNPLQTQESVANPAIFEGVGSLHATQMKVVAIPKTTVDRIVKFLDEVPIKIRDMLNKVNSGDNSGWYDATASGAFNTYTLYGSTSTKLKQWPQIGAWQNHKSHLDPRLEYFRTFFLNRTESLFISNPGQVVTNSYKKYHEISAGNNYPTQRNALNAYLSADFGDTYYEYLGLIGTIAYLNSNELFTDGKLTGPYTNRTYPQWCRNKNIRPIIDRHITALLAGSASDEIYTTEINDTEDIIKMHQYLSDLKAFVGMDEMPVFDVKEFHIKFKGKGVDTSILTNPFNPAGLPKVPLEGLNADAYPLLSNTYGDVFYQTILDVGIMQPALSFSKGYAYSSVRIPVYTRGVTGKVYGMRPGSIYAFNAASPMSDLAKSRGGSKGLNYTQIGVGLGALYIPILGYLMYKNFGTGYNNNKWKTFE